MPKVRNLIAALALTVAGVAVAPAADVEAASGCGAAMYLHEGRAWCADLNQSLNEWVRVGIKCTATGNTIFYGAKIYIDGGGPDVNYSVRYCGLGYGYVAETGIYLGYG